MGNIRYLLANQLLTCLFLVGLGTLPFLPTVSLAEPNDVPTWVADSDGELAPNEFRVVDPKGAVTRRPCPYTCAMRQIPKESCKEWRSITNAVDGDCYVQDLRISQDNAMPRDTRSESKRTEEGYNPK